MSHPATTLTAPPRPTLGSLIAGVSLACLLSAYFLFDTLILRQPVTQTTAQGREYVMRLPEHREVMPRLKAGGTRIIGAITKAKEEAAALKTELAERTIREQAYRAELADLAAQLNQAEQMLADLKLALEGLPRNYEDAYALQGQAAGR